MSVIYFPIYIKLTTSFKVKSDPLIPCSTSFETLNFYLRIKKKIGSSEKHTKKKTVSEELVAINRIEWVKVIRLRVIISWNVIHKKNNYLIESDVSNQIKSGTSFID